MRGVIWLGAKSRLTAAALGKLNLQTPLFDACGTSGPLTEAKHSAMGSYGMYIYIQAEEESFDYKNKNFISPFSDIFVRRS
jgi:hypothetical protein